MFIYIYIYIVQIFMTLIMCIILYTWSYTVCTLRKLCSFVFFFFLLVWCSFSTKISLSSESVTWLKSGILTKTLPIIGFVTQPLPAKKRDGLLTCIRPLQTPFWGWICHRPWVHTWTVGSDRLRCSTGSVSVSEADSQGFEVIRIRVCQCMTDTYVYTIYNIYLYIILYMIMYYLYV